MKVEKMSKRWRPFQGIWLVMMMLCFVQCKESSEGDPAVDFDPSKPITVTDFLPKEGGSGSNLVIYGDNFGSDVSRLKVVIGGKSAKVVNVKGKSLYCIVPSEAFDGDIHVSVLDEQGEELVQTSATENFVYVPKWIVSDFIGTYYEVDNDFEEKEGPFDDCGAFKGVSWLTFDPLNPNHLYFSADNHSARLIDFEEEWVSYFRHGFSRVTAINWKLNGDRDMIVSDNHASNTRNAHYIFSRSSGFQQSTAINQPARGVQGAMVHPVNGEFYYSLFRAGEIHRYDFATEQGNLAFPNPYNSVAIFMVVHPSGDYAYITNYNTHYILRSDYDYTRKTFKAPYPVAGGSQNAGWLDGVGTNARLNHPAQGVFVKNPDYEEQGGDQYDYYFCDASNHCIRILTPRGRVSTFAGRGNNGTNGYANGDLRLEARFDTPKAIAYDELRQCFYVGDTNNWIIRKIAKETPDESEEEIVDEAAEQ
ncbi:IPT/TIG domain-containing protein [Sphingobacterium sp. SGR-19]|uniref:IPT/TIG domain-containing protein n=1 Tax=Sphingobacterium sp. SGR-19 TaxID=2710886 RepID=UPI0013EA5DFF|nr:IPT/TIG domain-containing protein [Sphingobacterium sp. SGR-19]NGM66556.1 hypothetical protein [Sphingobacterium sp. SGR-19]